MTKNILDKEIKKFIKSNLGLNYFQQDNDYIIHGEYQFSLTYNFINYQGTEEIKIIIPQDFPKAQPKFYMGNIPKNMEHVYPDKSCCLATIGEIIEFLSQEPSFEDYFFKFIDPFIYTVNWYRDYGTYPFGEREHGALGLVSYYKENWNVTIEQYIKAVMIVYENNYRGHLPCFCESDRILRNCHGKRLLQIIKNESLKKIFLYEAAQIIKEVSSNETGDTSS